jgi:demethylmenaquinone methyltransferase/2-methoxy-6-polyprenyl-1,4-benzoquinol methylase
VTRPSAHYVKALFEKGAPFYDATNTVLSLGIDDSWRRDIARAIIAPEDGIVADVATGTAKVAVSIARKHPRMKVIGIDFSPNMVVKGAKRVQRKNLAGHIDLAIGDGCMLPLNRESVDAVTISFGIRNIPAREAALTEFFQVIKPGGQLIILEFGFPSNPVLRWGYSLYFNYILPWLGSVLIRVEKSYDYLKDSVYRFPSNEVFMDMVRDAGFKDVTVKPLTGGIVNMFTAVKQ